MTNQENIWNEIHKPDREYLCMEYPFCEKIVKFSCREERDYKYVEVYDDWAGREAVLCEDLIPIPLPGEVITIHKYREHLPTLGTLIGNDIVSCFSWNKEKLKSKNFQIVEKISDRYKNYKAIKIKGNNDLIAIEMLKTIETKYGTYIVEATEDNREKIKPKDERYIEIDRIIKLRIPKRIMF